MNQYEWKRSPKFDGKYEWYNKTRKIQKSLQYNSDPNAKIIHHLRDTEEQRKYNDEHYEFWGFNEDGTFEYGKFVIFVTDEWHTEYHRHSEETRKKLSEATSGKNNPMYDRCHTEDTRIKISSSLHGNKCHFGHHHSSETRSLLSAITKQQMSDPAARELRHNLMIGRKLSDTTKEKISKKSKQYIALVRAAYIDYKANDGSLSWNEFQKYYKHLDSQDNK